MAHMTNEKRISRLVEQINYHAETIHDLEAQIAEHQHYISVLQADLDELQAEEA